MATTYCENTDLILDNGQSVDEILDVDLTTEQVTTRKDNARLRAYRKINNIIRGFTSIPATHIDSLKWIEVDYVIADLLQGSYTSADPNRSDWQERYSKRAEDDLKDLTFPSSYDTPVANSLNTGDGTITITTNDDFCKTENWILVAQSATQFTVKGSLSGFLPTLTVGTQWPESDWISYRFSDYGLPMKSLSFEEYPITVLITQGSTNFAQNDKFTFKTYSSSYKKPDISGSIKRG